MCFPNLTVQMGKHLQTTKKHQYQLVLIIFLFAYFGSKLILNEHICDHVT